ncbi:hypothetical protein K7X08_020114 [Anisodus acutangulus]|uniref:Uncharacterized protein n=1 Tax=Anisodus acutangulus TaxID=402998 RepID=A0A9Q1M6E9_9SOLA|nr:hypothetical protein K7X08_020114 [Anisodus acutangulus]
MNKASEVEVPIIYEEVVKNNDNQEDYVVKEKGKQVQFKRYYGRNHPQIFRPKVLSSGKVVDYPNGNNKDKRSNKCDKGQAKKIAAVEVQVQVQNKSDILNVVEEREQDEPNQLKHVEEITKENGIDRPSGAHVESNEHRIEEEKTKENEDGTAGQDDSNWAMNNDLLLSKKVDEKERNTLQEIDSGRPAKGVDDKNIDEEGAMQVPIQDLPVEELKAVVNSLKDISPDILQEAFEVAKESETFEVARSFWL